MNNMPSNLRNALNFSGGPGALPESVLQQVHESIIAVPEVGLSILGISFCKAALPSNFRWYQ